MRWTLVSLALAGIPAVAWADVITVTLSVPGMNCAACPITVKKALTRVEGVVAVDVSLQRLEAVVRFDDRKVALDRLVRATADAGYPSTAKSSAR